MNENQTDQIPRLMRHIKRLYLFIALLASAFLILAALVWWRSPHEILLKELRDLSFQMAQQPIPPEQEAEIKHDREQSLEDRIAEAKAIVLCQHTISWGKVKCKVVRILKHEPGFKLPYDVGKPISDHERKVERDALPGEGQITFLTGSSFSPWSSLVINNGHVTDSYVDPSRPSNDSDVWRDFTVEQVIQMIETANKASEALGTNVLNLQH